MSASASVQEKDSRLSAHFSNPRQTPSFYVDNKPQHSIILFVPTPPATTCRVAKTNKQEIWRVVLTQKGGQNVTNTSQASPLLSSVKHCCQALTRSWGVRGGYKWRIAIWLQPPPLYEDLLLEPADLTLTSLSDGSFLWIFILGISRSPLNRRQRPNPRSKRL